MARPPAVIAVSVVMHDGLVLVGRRPAAAADAPGLHEFPGGKVEPGESAAEAAARETFEEAGLTIRVGPLLCRTTAASSRGPIELVFFRATPVDPAAPPRPPFSWVAHGDLPGLAFPPANRGVVEWLAAGGRGPPPPHGGS